MGGWAVRVYEWCLLCGQRACAGAGNPLCIRCTADVELEVEAATSGQR